MSRLSENGSFSLNMRPLEVYSGRTIHDLAEGDKARHDLAEAVTNMEKKLERKGVL